MDTKISRYCPNCSQLYQIKIQASQQHGNVPLFLSCGHTICENCVKNIIKFEEPIECKMCHKNTEVSSNDLANLMQNKIKLYDLFPVNIYMLGELTFQTMEHTEKNKSVPEDFFIDVQAIMQKNESTEGQCLECHSTTTKMCQHCATILCSNCFNKSHKNFVIFKNHVLINIGSQKMCYNCETHTEKPLDYYCKDCLKAICMDCMMVGGEKSCKSHDVVAVQEVNSEFIDQITEISPQVDETFRRLTKTAFDIGHLIYNAENEVGTSEFTQAINDIDQHFSKLLCTIQKHKEEVLNVVLKLQFAEKDSLLTAKNDVTEAITYAKSLIDKINASLESNKLKQANLSHVLDSAKQFVESPWYLQQKEAKSDPLKINVNEDLCALSNDYIHLEGNIKLLYKLCTTAEMKELNIEIPPPPPTTIFPPELPKDVRKQNKTKVEKENVKPTFYKSVPKYRSKSGSCSSLNSINSDNSQLSSSSHTRNQIVQPVMPFPESVAPKQLREGGQELIYISHIIDPHNFYVQRACQQQQVESLIREFRNAVSLPKPSVNHVAEGKVYLAFNKADNMWQRCRVISIDRKDGNRPLFHVFCVDFGSTEVVNIDKLRLLSPARMRSPCPFAINCSLANCEPINGHWTSEDAFLIQNIIDNKQAVLHIRRIRSMANNAISLECDVTTFEDGVSLAHALAFQGRARICNPKLTYPNIPGAMEKLKLFISNNDYKPNTVEEVYLTHIISPDNFFVRKKHSQKAFEKLCEELDHEYSLAVSTGTIHLPEVGMVCAVNVEKNPGWSVCGRGGKWARGLIREVGPRGRVRVLLTDAGGQLTVSWTVLRRLRPHFTTLRALATECHLAGITPHNKKWSVGSVALLQKYQDRVLELHVEDIRSGGSLGVTLYENIDEENIICINQQMIKHKFAVSFGLPTFYKNDDIEDQVITNKSPLDKPKPNIKPKTDHVKILKRNEPVKVTAKVNEEDLEAKDKGPVRLEAKVLHYQSPSLIYVSLISQQKTFNELFDDIQKYYSKKKTQPKDNWKVGDRCCTICKQSQTWRRAVIVEIEGSDAKVFYSDFACIESVPMSDLRELTRDFASYGDAAFKCHLCGVIPAVGEEWPSLTKEYLKEMLDAYKRIFITKLGNFKDKSMPVELWVYHTVQGGALEPNTSEWRCLNKKIIEQGLGIPDVNQQPSSETDTTENTDDDMLSFLNITGSVRDWLQLEPLPMKSLKIKTDTTGNTGPPSPVDDANMINDDQNDTIFISDWLPPEPFSNEEFTGMPTYIDNNGVIYLHDVCQQDRLDLIRKALDFRFKNPDPKAKFTKWSVGEPCVALFFLDNRFYRGKVIDVNNETSTCVIHYIDYGNEESCSFADLRKSIALYEIPAQAHKCVLDRIRPVGKKWERETLDYIHKSIVEKHCFVKIKGEEIDGVTPIDLKFDKLWINDHLVEFKKAVYTDGSRAVVRKFAGNTYDTLQSEELYLTESDSGPDYIVEVDTIASQSFTSQDSFNMQNLENVDWNKIVEEQEDKLHINENYMTYPNNTVENFICNITVINDIHTLELNVVQEDDKTELYDKMFENLQQEGNNMLPLNGIFENKACIALFPEDEQWYRAKILEYSESKNRMKVRYIDYGNTEIISLADVREIDEKYVKLPPASISVKLHGIKINPDIDMDVIVEEYKNVFLDKGPFNATIISNKDSLPSVELRDDNSKLVYENLIEKNIFLKENECNTENQ